jgi:hypothetical protein
MQAVLILLFGISFVACHSKPTETQVKAGVVEQPLLTKDTLNSPGIESDWQNGFALSHDPDVDSIWFKPVRFYLSDKECSKLAIDFYYGRRRPGDNEVTDELLELATTDDNKLRPFYRWCLNKTIFIQDGALAEHTGVPARMYAEKFPKELFEYLDIDSSGEKYSDWVSAINYSGYYSDEDYSKPNKMQKKMASLMNANCKACDSSLKKRIDSFARDCFVHLTEK